MEQEKGWNKQTQSFYCWTLGFSVQIPENEKSFWIYSDFHFDPLTWVFISIMMGYRGGLSKNTDNKLHICDNHLETKLGKVWMKHFSSMDTHNVYEVLHEAGWKGKEEVCAERDTCCIIFQESKELKMNYAVRMKSTLNPRGISESLA